jgi:branched-chain amino acid transport system substrate-binding protein
MKRLSLIFGVVILLGNLLTACQPATSTIKVGLNVELTGSIPAVGESSKNAAELAVKEINDAGGLDIGGRKYKIELVIKDNQDNKDTAGTVTQALVDEGVLAMIGPNASRNAIPASEIAETKKLLMISPWSTNPQTTLEANSITEHKHYVFRAAFIDDFQGAVAAKFTTTDLKSKKPAVLYAADSAYNTGIAQVYKQTLDAGGVPVVAFQTYKTGDTDFSKQLKVIQDAGADSLFLPNYYNEVPLQVKQAHTAGFTGWIVGSDSWGNLEIIAQCGGDCEGAYFTTHYATDIATPKAQSFIQAYQAAYAKTPDDVAALTYDSFGLLFQALQNAGKADGQAARDALAGITAYEGVTGNMQFKGTGDPIKSAVVIQIRSGKFAYFQSANP